MGCTQAKTTKKKKEKIQKRQTKQLARRVLSNQSNSQSLRYSCPAERQWYLVLTKRTTVSGDKTDLEEIKIKQNRSRVVGVEIA